MNDNYQETRGASARNAPARRRSGGRSARLEARKSIPVAAPYITRNVPLYQVLGEEGMSLIENNADLLLEEIGIEFRGDAEALKLWKDAGADPDGERVRFPKNLCRTLIRQSAPQVFTQHARNPGTHGCHWEEPHGAGASLWTRLSFEIQMKDDAMEPSTTFRISSN